MNDNQTTPSIKEQITNFFLKKDGGKRKLKKQALKIAKIVAIVFLPGFIILDGIKNQSGINSLQENQESIKKAIKQSDLNTIRFMDLGERPQKPKPPKTSRKQKKLRSSSPLKLVSLYNHEEIRIPPGTTLSARFVLDTTDGPVKLKSLENLSSRGRVLAEQGSTLWGQAQSRGSRLIIRLSHLIGTDNKQYTLQGGAAVLDPRDKALGVRGTRLGAKTLKALGLFSLGLLSQTGKALTQKQYIGGSETGEVHVKPDFGNALIFGASTAGIQSTKEFSEELKNTKQQVVVKKGKQALVMFSGPLRLQNQH